MCGIVGAIAKRPIEKILIDGLKRLEYRGYDSAGIALLDIRQKLQRLRTLGKVKQLEDTLYDSGLQGFLGIAHTRWATHGAPAEHNAHPFISHDIALVHNGIIENHDELRAKLTKAGYEFTSQTDSETVVHLIHSHFQNTQSLYAAVAASVKELKGAYALGIFSARHPQHLIAVRHGSPLVIGKSLSENFIASDPLALLSQTQQFIYLEDNDIADITSDSITIYANDKKVERKLHHLEVNIETAERGTHRHYMSKEIAEQPKAIADSLDGRISETEVLESAFGSLATPHFRQTKQVHIVACGTSYHAALVARYWLESIAGIACTVEVASEYRYRNPVVPENTLFVCLSQSGETADTLAALRMAKKSPYLCRLAICNVLESSLVREADLAFMTRAGIEIGVASTKAFTTQLIALLLLTLSLGKQHGLSSKTEKSIVASLQKLPHQLEDILRLEPQIAKFAAFFADKEHALFLGRGALFPIALEGALKLKEISYIHAEGYPAGELKHGPLALVDKDMPVIAIAPNDDLLEKLKSNLHEVRARGGELFIFTDQADALVANRLETHVVEMPTIDPLLSPIAYTIPLQLLAYHVAIIKGTDVDQPRNLAKSVTVE